MSTDAPEQRESVTEESTRKRVMLSLQDRYKIADYLRQQLAPITADTKLEIAAKVSEATGVQISWGQLDYLIGELPDLKLEEKIAVNVKPSDPVVGALAERVANLETHAFNVDQRVVSVAKGVSDLTEIISKLTDRIIALESEQALIKDVVETNASVSQMLHTGDQS